MFFLSIHAELREEKPDSRLEEDETQLKKRSAQSVEELLRADPEQDQYVSWTEPGEGNVGAIIYKERETSLSPVNPELPWIWGK